MTFMVSHSLVMIEDGLVRGAHKGYGLPHLLIAIAQNLCGWNRGVTGFQYLLDRNHSLTAATARLAGTSKTHRYDTDFLVFRV